MTHVREISPVISNVRLRRLCLNRENKYEPVHAIYDGPSLEEALTHAVRGFHNYSKRLPWDKDPRGTDISITGISFGEALGLYHMLIKSKQNGEHPIAPGLRLDITVRGQG